MTTDYREYRCVLCNHPSADALVCGLYCGRVAAVLDKQLDDMIDCRALEDALNSATSIREKLLRGEL